MSDHDCRQRQAASFGTAAEHYERGRPPYPPQAVDWLLPASAHRVLDLGAGTGKLTRALVERGVDVTAVEPSAGMRAQLSAQLPQLSVLAGSAEAIPLPDGSMDAVLVAQAWHWVDPERALPEVARVLGAEGRLGLVWNLRDEAAPWVAALTDLLRVAGEDMPGIGPVGAVAPDLGRRFGPVEAFEVSWMHYSDRAGVLDMIASRSYVITAPDEQRRQLMNAVAQLLDTHSDLAGRTRIDLPYRTYCYRVTKR